MFDRYSYGDVSVDSIIQHPHGGYIGEMSFYGSDEVFLVWFRAEEDARALVNYAGLLFQSGRNFVRPRTESVAVLEWIGEYGYDEFGSAFDVNLPPEWQIDERCTPLYARYTTFTDHVLQIWAEDQDDAPRYRAILHRPGQPSVSFSGDSVLGFLYPLE